MMAKIGTVLGVVGAGAVALGNPLAANMVWLVGNPCLIYHNYSHGEQAQMWMFTIYFTLSIYGVINLW
jgi:hypothetical protein